MRDVLKRSIGGDKSILGVVGLVAFFGIFALVFLKIPQGLFTKHGNTVTVVFKNPGQLTKDDPVRVKGVLAGKVKQLKLIDGGRATSVKLEVFDDALPLYRDARAAVRWRTLLGASFVVDLDPGHPAAGKADQSAPIPLSRSSNQVEVDQVTNVFGGGAKRGLQRTLAELPKAFSNHKAPAETLTKAADVAPSLRSTANALRGESPGEITDTVRNTDRVVQALDTPTEDVRQLIQGGAGTLEVTARREQDVRATIDEAAKVLPTLRTTMTQLNGTLDNAHPLIDKLQKPATQIAPTANRLRPTLVDADQLLDQAQPLLSSLRPAVTSLAKSSRVAQPVLDHLEPDLKLVDEKLLPDLARRSPDSQRTTYEMLGPTFEALHVPFGYFDSNGSYVRFLASGGSDLIDSAPCRTLLTDPDAQSLIACDDIKDVFGRIFGISPSKLKKEVK